MNNNQQNQQIDNLLEFVEKPSRAKRPSNIGLTFALVFFNLVALLFDVIASITVFNITHNILYSILTFFAGVVPLAMHESLFVRAYASQTQRWIAVTGAVISVLSIITVGVLAGLINVGGLILDETTAKIAVILIIVLVTAIHGLLSAIYFYSDEGIRAQHTMTNAMGFHSQRLKKLSMADQILQAAALVAKRQNQIVGRHDERMNAKAALESALRQLNGEDEMPDEFERVLAPRSQSRQYASETQARDNHRDQQPDPTSPSRNS